MAEPWQLSNDEIIIDLPGELDDMSDEDIRDVERVIQRKLLEWLKIVTVKADYADIGDIRIIAEPDWRRLCVSLGVEPE